jgi:hypothetical protein
LFCSPVIVKINLISLRVPGCGASTPSRIPATRTSFKIFESGDVLDINHLDKSLIQLTRAVRRNTSGGK